ncbi:MAG: hypothetical protein KUG72_09135 [Pseudomonadales bacterium]|nr:hypothetical protein [Pseudomonadales bacterium]
MNLNDLQLELPSEKAIKDSLVSIDPVVLRQELQQIPYGSMVDALDQVTGKLALLNRTQISSKQRFEILECFLEPCQIFFGYLSSNKYRKNLPVFLDTAERIGHLSRELGYGYKLALTTFPESKRFAKKKLVERVYNAMAVISLNLLIDYQRHQQNITHHWNELNQLYAYARSKNLTKNTVTFTSPLSIATDIDGLYRQVSVMAISDPYQLIAEQIVQIWSYLAQYAESASITVLQPGETPDSGFVINLKEQTRPQSYRWFDQTTSLLSLKLDPLNEHLDRHLKLLKADPDTNIPGFSGNYPEQTRILLTELKETWLQTSQRKENRIATKTPVSLVYGIRDIHYLATHAAEPLPVIREQLRDQMDGIAIDESTGGAGIVLATTPKYSLEPGQLVLLFDENNGTLQTPKLAIVCWNALDRSSQKTQLGIKYLPGQIYPVTVKAKDKVTVDTYPRYGLLLQPSPDQQENWQMITSQGLYQENRKLALQFDNQPSEQPAKANELISQSIHIEHFAIEILSIPEE